MKIGVKGHSDHNYYRITGPDYSDLADREYNEHALQINCVGTSTVDYRLVEDYLARGRRDYYILYCILGELTLHMQGGVKKIKRGDSVLIYAGTPFLFTADATPDNLVKYYWTHFTGNDVRGALETSGIREGEIYSLGVSEEIMQIYESIFVEFRYRQPTMDYAVELNLRRLLLATGRAEAHTSLGRLDTSIKYIHTNFRLELTVQALAEMEYLGVSRYREIFKEALGMSPGEYITKLRIEKAKDLLIQGKVTIASVAERVGYKDRLYFQRIFKKYTGKTPRQWRLSAHSI